jgi:hypothetical protein
MRPPPYRERSSSSTAKTRRPDTQVGMSAMTVTYSAQMLGVLAVPAQKWEL